jgi:hypothetical protein
MKIEVEIHFMVKTDHQRIPDEVEFHGFMSGPCMLRKGETWLMSYDSKEDPEIFTLVVEHVWYSNTGNVIKPKVELNSDDLGFSSTEEKERFVTAELIPGMKTLGFHLVNWIKD